MSSEQSSDNQREAWPGLGTGSRKGTLSNDGPNLEPYSPRAPKRQLTINYTASTLGNEDYTVGWICALLKEMAAARAMLDSIHESLPSDANDSNAYVLGSMGAA